MKESLFDIPVSTWHDLECGEGSGEKHASFILGTGPLQVGMQAVTYLLQLACQPVTCRVVKLSFKTGLARHESKTIPQTILGARRTPLSLIQ